MPVVDLFDSLRDEADPRVWTAAVKLARSGAVVGVGQDDEEIRLHVKADGRPVAHDVYLWPDDEDTGCDCGMPEPCVHVCAGTIAVVQGLKVGAPLPEPSEQYQVKLRYDFTTHKARLAVQRTVLRANGTEEPLRGTLSDSSYLAARGDTQAEKLLVLHRGGPLDEERLRRLLVFLEGLPPATLDGKRVKLSPDPVRFVIKVRDEGERFRVGLYRPPGLDALFMGAALVKGVLRPTSYAELPEDERRALNPRRSERVFDKDQVSWLVSAYLPRLREFGLPVEIETDRLPTAEALTPRVQVHVKSVAEGLEVRPVVVYGDPPVARIEKGSMVKLGSVIPARDIAAEKREARAFTEVAGLHVGVARVLPPGEAVQFLEEELPRLEAEIVGRVDRERFHVVRQEVQPLVQVTDVPESGADRGPTGAGGFSLRVQFRSEQGEADPREVLRAWHMGRSLVPLLDGGYAPLPAGWLEQHGALLEELLEARDADGRVARNATAALAELVDETDADAPPDLRRLRSWLEGDEGLPEDQPPATFRADLRPYQLTGYRWLAFLRRMDLHGILADDMGLGKTVQALAAIQAAGGHSLVVAPTSVLRNWEREAAKFAPDLVVNVYHGPQRALRPDANLTLTSYALLRMDLDLLRKVPFTYAILDEAQAIKNPDSQTARAACRLEARHRLCLTGTPVENRLEELWSLFRFLMPGLLGPRRTFRDRFEKPIEIGDRDARGTLQRRVRPYVLRRLKRQVATDLPALTEMVIRCEMSRKQREIYDAVRLAARRDVWQMLGQDNSRNWQMQVLEALLRMRQACCDPSLIPGVAEGEAGACKLDRLEEMLIDLVADGHRTLIFSQWTSLLDRVEPRLAELGIDHVRLDGATRDRQGIIDHFQSDDGPPVFLLSLKAGGTGLNLTAADYVIHLDPWWNPAVEQQAIDRAHRIGQDKPVVACRFIAEGTVEERILDLQEAKRDLLDAALGGEGGLLRALSADELRHLFEDA